MAVNLGDIQERLMRLNQIGIALSSERNLDVLLHMILREARDFTNADAGSLYIVEERGVDGKAQQKVLHFKVTQNDTLEKRTGQPIPFKAFDMPVSKDSIAGYVACTGECLNLADVYNIPNGTEYHFKGTFDMANDYRTRSVLTLPMHHYNGDIIGVLQLINSLDENGTVVPFDYRYEDMVRSLSSQAAVAIRNAQLTSDLKGAYLETIMRLSIAAEFKDEDTAEHIRRMSKYSEIIARNMGLPNEQQEMILYSSPMHDVGKIGISDAILLKPGKLTDEEFTEMKKHSLYGAKILQGARAPVLEMSYWIALTHHEKWDGTGYPYGKKGEEIPIEGRVAALADVFDALTSKRCYKPAFPLEKAMAIIEEGKGKHFDPAVVEAFMAGLPEILEVKLRENPDGELPAAS